MWYICFCGSIGEILLITNKGFQLQPSSLLLLLFEGENQIESYFILQRTKVLSAECHNCICNQWQIKAGNMVNLVQILQKW